MPFLPLVTIKLIIKAFLSYVRNDNAIVVFTLGQSQTVKK